ncbi:MAG: flagellar protein FlaG [Clostridia bacterium]|nr:flagellar protein FlaG [Clostridia bacterium]
MKIDGMDAPGVTYSKVSGSNSSELKEDYAPSQQVKVNTGENKEFQSIDNKNLSQISSYEKKELPIAEKVVIDAIERANKAIMGANRKFEFSIHEKTKQIMIKVIDSDTNEIIREIPPEKTLDMVAKMWEMAGIVVDERR